MTPPIQIMIVDDSVVIRRILAKLLSRDPDLAVIGTAANGRIAVDQIPQMKPDVIILDLEMPELDGFGVLEFLRKNHPGIRTIVFSTLSQRGASQTIEALSLGASDYSTKPSSMVSGTDDASVAQVSEELIRKIKQLGLHRKGDFGGLPLESGGPGPAAAARGSSGAENRKNRSFKAVAVGISTGGPEALLKMLPVFSKSFPVPILIVQHMPPVFTKLLSDRLASSSRIRVVEASEGMKLEAGTAYIAPGNFHMEVSKERGENRIRLNQNPQENSCRPSADVLFRSVAKAFGGQALGVIMTGMGQDGYRGLKEMKAEGACVLAQDEASSVVWGMPASVVQEGMADQVVPLSKMGATIEEWIAGAPVAGR